MIRLTRLHGEPVVVNADLIELLEASNEVVVVLTTGRRLVVRESADEVIDIVRAWQQSLRAAVRPPLHAGRRALPATEERDWPARLGPQGVQERMEDG